MANMKIMAIILLAFFPPFPSRPFPSPLSLPICWLKLRQTHDVKGIDFFWKSGVVKVVHNARMRRNFTVALEIQHRGIFSGL